MIGLHKVMLYIATGLGHMWVVGHQKESVLVIHQFLALTYHRADTVALLVQILQFLFLDNVVGLLLIRIIHIALQVHHILQRSKSGLFQ